MSNKNIYKDYGYTDRKTKALFVWKKYKKFLRVNRVLDVGADECYLKEHLDLKTHYVGIGLGNNKLLKKVDLEKKGIPYKNNSFDSVLCLDVLEHLDNIHNVFDELCRVSKKWVIISLPNPWSSFIYAIRKDSYRNNKYMKFYGLEAEKELDRHKWFFTSSEAIHFIEKNAIKNNMKIKDLFIMYDSNNISILSKLIWLVEKILFFRNVVSRNDVYSGTHWWLLEKSNDSK